MIKPSSVRRLFSSIRINLFALGLVASAGVAQATTVQFQTVLGDFEVNLFDKHTPKTVENFLAYVAADAYKDTAIHRSVPGFVVQGGGFKYTGTPSVTVPLAPVTTTAPVINEPKFSNIRGTIAMAKLGSNPNSATSQWFISVADNSANLDYQNGGFTVFGQVTGNGMAIVDAIAAINKNHNKPIPFNEIPLRSYTAGVIDETHLVMIDNIVVLNASPDTADGLNPKLLVPKNNDGGNNGGGNNDSGSNGGGGGSVGYLFLLILVFGLLVANRKTTQS